MRYEPTQNDIRSLREWLVKIPYLPHDIEDHMLESFLRGCKCSLERAKIVLDNYYHTRIKYPYLMTNLDPLLPSAQLHMEVSIKVPLPKKTKDGSTIIVTSLEDDDPDKFDAEEVFKRFAAILHHMLYENEFGSGRLTFIVVCGKLKLGHALKLTPNIISSAIGALMSSSPARIEAVHGVNVSPAAEWIFSFLKTLLKSKIAERIHLHNKFESLLQWYPKEILPSDFGGDEESLEKIHAKFRKRIEANSAHYRENEMKLRKIEVLRPKTSSDDIFGGSFRKLEVD